MEMRGQDKEDFEAQPLLGQHGDQGAQFFDELFAISRRAPRGALCVPRLFVPAARSSRTRVRRVTMVAVGLMAMCGALVVTFNAGRTVGEEEMAAFAAEVEGHDLEIVVQSDTVSRCRQNAKGYRLILALQRGF